MAEDGTPPGTPSLVPPREVDRPPLLRTPHAKAATPGPSGGLVAESDVDPPGPIPNPVVTQRSAGEYCGGDPTGGEAAADTPQPR